MKKLLITSGILIATFITAGIIIYNSIDINDMQTNTYTNSYKGAQPVKNTDSINEVKQEAKVAKSNVEVAQESLSKNVETEPLEQPIKESDFFNTVFPLVIKKWGNDGGVNGTRAYNVIYRTYQDKPELFKQSTYENSALSCLQNISTNISDLTLERKNLYLMTGTCL